MHLIFSSVKELFLSIFPNPNKSTKTDKDEYGVIKAYFSGGNIIELLNDDPDKTFRKKLDQVAGLKRLADDYLRHDEDVYAMMELILFGLSECEVLGKNVLDNSMEFGDPLSDMLRNLDN